MNLSNPSDILSYLHHGQLPGITYLGARSIFLTIFKKYIIPLKVVKMSLKSKCGFTEEREVSVV